jgi:hypothetical protein
VVVQATHPEEVTTVKVISTTVQMPMAAVGKGN